jgi:Flp pilus assembly protein TadD
VCASCHAAEAERWQGSHHDLAMQPATSETVLGDFSDVTVDAYGTPTRFFQRDGRFFVNTQGPDGQAADFEITHVFGVAPLQQFLASFPGGRLQALGLAWDARDAEAGGQRYFPLYPDETIPVGDPLHWTGPNLNWNAMCAECHSTDLRKGYDAALDGYDTTWQELDVSCEACHGPGSRHQAWAEAGAGHPSGPGLPVELRNPARWSFGPGERIAHREGPPASAAELDACGRCHARRATLREDYVFGQPLLDSHRPALLERELYFADGQIQDEVYVWGSFRQSRMYAAGVRCSDCHDPHSLGIADADATCQGCHQSEAFATPEHHRHPVESAGARCVSCHMASRTYMGVDGRRDHGFRVPRPALSAEIGAPDPCTSCHQDRDAAWAIRTAEAWWGPEAPHFGRALHAGRTHQAGAAAALAELVRDPDQPAIARATALELLGEQLGPDSLDALVLGLADADGQVRLAALEALNGLPPEERVELAVPLLRDPLLAVRIDAAQLLNQAPATSFSPEDRRAVASALDEYREVQRSHADRPDAHMNLGVLHAQAGALQEARAEYETAIRLAPWFTPARVNLADLYRQADDNEAAERVLREALEIAPDAAQVHHALGLTLVRLGQLPAALEALERAADLEPQRARYAYVHAIALHSTGETARALAVLEDTWQRHPGDLGLLVALATIHRESGSPERALEYAREWVRLAPADEQARQLLAELEAQPD